MIANEHELQLTHQRITRLQDLLARLRQTARPEEFDAVTSGYRLEIERMQVEIMEYLLSPPSVKLRPQPA